MLRRIRCFAGCRRIGFWITLTEKKTQNSRPIENNWGEFQISKIFVANSHKWKLVKNHYHLLYAVPMAVWMRNCSVTWSVPPLDFGRLDSMYRCCWCYCFVAMWTMCLVVCSYCVGFAMRIRDPWDRLAFSIFPIRRCVVAYFVDSGHPWNCRAYSMRHDRHQMLDDGYTKSKWKLIWSSIFLCGVWLQVSLTQYLYFLNCAWGCAHNR